MVKTGKNKRFWGYFIKSESSRGGEWEYRGREEERISIVRREFSVRNYDF
jgi:hypothetical protein